MVNNTRVDRKKHVLGFDGRKLRPSNKRILNPYTYFREETSSAHSYEHQAVIVAVAVSEIHNKTKGWIGLSTN